ncbi:methyltransferase, FxLD system [Streptomyces sp. NBC_01808]|uniref:methyltransferase, FxLD system n=1 Tax=Streptomyces sp. NBC_01808 TaxID=2975947 RepID=UPI002DDAB3C3|nr:methyltransferase, FxLD system [Streptomyces sp. NBC_01808]WSA38952.1 methyltransferase, FxLD system [Streptomyces sp. NBC_01808]
MITLDEPAPAWRQVNLSSDTWQAAENRAVRHHLPLLAQAEDDGAITSWWFIRKRETWRLRLRPAANRDEDTTTLLMQMAEASGLNAYADVVYEPETYRFGGKRAIEIAHRLFHADSRHVLAHLARACGGPDHRHEIGLRLATRMMQAAGQDFYEQGDIWTAVAEHRATHAMAPSASTQARVQMLITAADDSPGSPLAQTPAWPAAYENAAKALADLAGHGALTRGIRAVLTDHLLFAFNRLGISAEHQAVVARAASRTVFHRKPGSGTVPRGSDVAIAQPTTVRPVTMDTAPAPTTDPRGLRDALVAKIDSLGTFRTEAVKNAFRTIPRHLFLPEVDLATAYAPKQVVTKRAADGTAVSSASSPNIVATMLEQLDAAPGQRVLEIGAATGINAALLAELVGESGQVVTIELDDDLAEGARTHLAEAGYEHVTVLCQDGALGAPDHAPFDRITVTAGAWDIPAAWWAQLAPGGRLVVPLRLHGSGLTRSIAFTRTEEDRMVSTNSAVCGFVPLRGAAEMGEIHVRLADDAILKIDADDEPDQAALAGVLTYPAHQQWTGIHVRHDEQAAHLDLWLATVDSGMSFGKLSIGPAARDLGLAAPARRWSGAAMYVDSTLAYLTSRPVDDDADELGIITHGPNADQLTEQIGDLLHRWSQQRPGQPLITAYPAATEDDQLGDGARITRPDTRLTIGW